MARNYYAGTHLVGAVRALGRRIHDARFYAGLGGGTGLVVVVDHVVLLVVVVVVGRLTTVCTVAPPVIHHVVDIVNGTLQRVDVVMVKAGVARVMMSNHVVMIGGVLTSPDAPVAVLPLVVNGDA